MEQTTRWRALAFACALLSVCALSPPAAAQEEAPASASPFATPLVERLAGSDRVATAIAVSRAVFEQAALVVVASSQGFADALAAAPLADRWGAPLLLTPPDRLADGLLDELDRLGARRVTLLGGQAAIAAEVEQALQRHGLRVGRVAGRDRYDTAARVAALLPDADEVLLVTGLAFPDGLTAGQLATAPPRPILLTPPDELPPVVRAALDERDPQTVTVVGGPAAVSPRLVAELAAEGRAVRRLSGPDRFATALAAAAEVLPADGPIVLWLATGLAFPDALAAGAAVRRDGAALLLVDGRDLAASAAVADWLRARKDRLARVVLLGGPAVITADAPRQLRAILEGRTLPRGGRSLLPEHRLVALYGHSATPALGVLGEQPPEQAADRAVAVARPYEQGDRPVLPTFEFIATVATAGPGPSGLYRAPTDPAVIQRSLDAIRRVRGYLVLDIQPGRSDFLTEAKRYEALLREPDVGLALDPEWRMGPNERPGEKVGSVHASEVNAVSAWLAEFVARHGLPEKLLLLHQFQERMIRERHLLEPREGLAITVQMDGFGSRSQKLATYARTRVDAPFWNGFKLFYDEDTDLYQPHEVLRLDPVPDWVSYQ